MTGDTTPISDEAMMADIRLCLASYGFIAANQAEFLLAEVARLSAAPLLVSADSSAQAERHANEMMGLTVAKNEEVDAMEHRARQAEAVVEGLRAELADAELRCANALADVLAQDAELAKRDARLTRLADALAEVVTELAALRSAGQTGGQGEPSDDGWGICEHGVMGSHDFAEDTEWGVNHHYCPGKRLAAAAVPVDYPRCAIEGCDKRVTCGSPAPNGYVSCCSIDHAQALGGFPDWPVRPAAAAKAAT